MDYSRYKIVFFGSSEFSLPAIEELARHKYTLLAAITQPDKPQGRSLKLAPTPVKILCKKSLVPVLEFGNLRSPEALESISKLKPDLGIVAAYGKIIPPEILRVPRLGCLNLHPSLLPRYRGPSPIQFAILNGEKETGTSVIILDNQLDHGPILAQSKTEILAEDTYQTLEKRLGAQAAGLLIKILPDWIFGKIVPKPQDERRATFTKLLTKEDGKISWKKTADEISRQIKAFTPWPGTWTMLSGIRIKILSAEPDKLPSFSEPGTIKCGKNELLATCGNHSTLKILEIQPESKRRISAASFIRGRPGLDGSKFDK